MADHLPAELARLLDAGDDHAHDRAWTEFLAAYSRLVLHACRSRAQDYDGAMDAYAYVLERLREGNCRRLRAYAVDRRSAFTTWLVVVTKRLCIDLARQRFGRTEKGAADVWDRDLCRRRLVELTAEEIDLGTIPDPSEQTPETEFEAASLHETLHHAITGLDAQDRLLLALRFEDGLTAERIASILRLPTPFHVYRRLTRILGVLRERLHRQDNPAV